MKIDIASNAFKDSLTVAWAATCIERGLCRSLRGLSIVKTSWLTVATARCPPSWLRRVVNLCRAV